MNISTQKTYAQLLEENELLRRRLEEPEANIDAIRHGELDAVVVSGPFGEEIYKAWKAFAIDSESPSLRDRYGHDHLGRSCLVARRLIEAGVSLVTVVFGSWDTHSHHLEHTRDKLLPPLDRAFSALLEDLDEHGLLEETLVAWTGEFGRTPWLNGNDPPGRDHWARVYSTVLAGGGIRGGQIYGSSDRLAGDPKDHSVHVRDFVATIYHALGYGPETQVVDVLGRSHFIVPGNPVMELF